LNEKSRIRQEVLGIRNALDVNERQIKDACIRERLLSLSECQQAARVFSFCSFRSEVSTIQLLQEFLSTGKGVIVPLVDRHLRRLKLFEILDIRELTTGHMGIPEPDVALERERDVNDSDLIIMPGAAFDARGNRLGYGAGYYDMLLAGLKKQIPLIALAYEEQIIDFVPSEPHDIPVHKIVTDKRILDCAQNV